MVTASYKKQEKLKKHIFRSKVFYVLGVDKTKKLSKKYLVSLCNYILEI